MSVQIGSHGVYAWLTAPDVYGRPFLRLCPEVVVGRYIAVTSVDSGILKPTEAERKEGWEVRHNIGYSPPVHSIDSLLCQVDGEDSPSFGEWYVFHAPRDLGETVFVKEFWNFTPSRDHVMVFVNWCQFALEPAQTVDPALAANFSTLFWKQIEWIQPDSYVADGHTSLTFVTRDRRLFETVLEKLEHRFKGVAE